MTKTFGQDQRAAECLIIKCPVCTSDAAGTLGVTGRQAGNEESEHVVLQCLDCGTVYLEPKIESANGRGPASKSSKALIRGGIKNAETATSLREMLADTNTDASRKVVYSPNVDSSVFHAFGGRHWMFYVPSEHSEYYGFSSISRLVEAGGARLSKYETVFAPSVWIQSLRCRIRDWGWHWSLEFLLTGPWLVPQAVAGLLELIAQFRGRGAIMRFEIENS